MAALGSSCLLVAWNVVMMVEFLRAIEPKMRRKLGGTETRLEAKIDELSKDVKDMSKALTSSINQLSQDLAADRACAGLALGGLAVGGLAYLLASRPPRR